MSTTEVLLDISPHFTQDFLDQHMSAWFGKKVQYTKFTSDTDFGKGDSYLSDLYRVEFYGKSLDEENKEVSVRTVIKTFPKNIARRKTFTSHIFFKNEIKFYEDVLPHLLKFQSEKNIDDPFLCVPKLFASVTNGENDVLAIEDLSIYGFKTYHCRQEGIDYPHCEATLKCFAKFHAISFAFSDQKPKEYEILKGKIREVYYYKENWNWYKNFWKRVCRCAIAAVEVEYPNTAYVDKIKEFATDEAFNRLVAATDSNTKTAVFSHGDSWTPNFLFKYEPNSDIPSEAKMIDFQLVRCASPILDIGFFIYACSAEDLRQKYYDSMLTFYYKALAKQIRALGSDPDKIYPWSTFMDEIKKLSYFGLGFSFEAIPAIILDPENAYDMELEGTEAVDVASVWRVEPIKSKSGRARMAGNIKHAIDNGYI